jgi:hypothetical protein
MKKIESLAQTGSVAQIVYSHEKVDNHCKEDSEIDHNRILQPT